MKKDYSHQQSTQRQTVGTVTVSYSLINFAVKTSKLLFIFRI